MNREVYLAISIDVEPDCSPNWVYSNPLTFTGVSYGIRDILQPLFNKFTFSPTYLINNVVLEDDRSVDILRSLEGNVEIGTHLHPEFIEPAKKFDDYAGKKGEQNCCFLPPEIEFAKLSSITMLFVERFGYSPTSFRAGRFSAGINTIKSLVELGYKVDTSVTPGIAWNDSSREGIVDYSGQHSFAYWLDSNSFPNKGKNKELLEIPVTIGSVSRMLIRKKHAWLRPYYSTPGEMIRLSKSIISGTHPDQPVILNMMFHNVEVMEGLSPYSKDKTETKQLIGQIEQYLNWCHNNGIEGITLSKYYEKFKNFR